MKSLLFFLFAIHAFGSCCAQVVPEASVDSAALELSGNIMIVFQDSRNNYWFGSYTNGLYKYDGKSLIHYTTENGLFHNRIDEIKEDKAGNVYFNTSGGVNKFDGKELTALKVDDTAINNWTLDTDDLWFRCMQDPGFVYRSDASVLHKLKIPSTRFGDEFAAQNPNLVGSYDVYTIYTDSKGNMWFGTAAMGALRFDGKSFDWIQETDVTELHNGPSNGVRSILEDKDGYFWFNSMYRYKIYGNKPENGSFYVREKSIGNLDHSADSDFHEYLAIVKDNNGELWIATYKAGVYRVKGKKITHYPVRKESKDITVFAVYKDNQGTIWLGTHENGAYRFNGNSFEPFEP